jgi:DNA-binding CsgD family transcriptional regulator
MGKVSNSDYRNILKLIYIANSCNSVENLAGSVLPRLSELFCGDLATFHLSQQNEGQLKIHSTKGFNAGKSYCELYDSGYYAQNPHVQQAAYSSQSVLTTGRSFSNIEWEKSEFYNNFIRPQHIYRELFIPLRTENRINGIFTIWRTKKQRDFNEEEFSEAEILSPHLAVALRNVGLVTQIQTIESNLLHNCETSSDGILLLDHMFSLYYSNAKAREICSYLSSGLDYHSSELNKTDLPVPQCIIEDCSNLLKHLLINRQAVFSPIERFIAIDGNRKFRARCSLIYEANQDYAKPKFMVVLNAIPEDQDFENVIKTRFNLTKREIVILYCILANMSYAEIAGKCFISRLTVHTHVKNIYKKMGAKNRVELDRYIRSVFYISPSN